MDPINARLERLERDYRRSRTWNRVALLALLVAVCAGFAQQQDPKLPEELRLKTLHAEAIRAGAIIGDRIDFIEALRGGDPQIVGLKRFEVLVGDSGEAVNLSMNASARQDEAGAEHPGASSASFWIGVGPTGVTCWGTQAYQPPVTPVGAVAKHTPINRDFVLACERDTGAALKLKVNGWERAVLGAAEGTDAEGRQVLHPESTLTLRDKAGKLLEQLPR